MISHSNPSLRGALATRQPIKSFAATIAKIATRFGIAVNALCPLRALRCNKNWITRTGRIMTVLIVVGFFPMQAWGCMPIASQLVLADKLISRTDNIVFAKLVNAEVMTEKERYGDLHDKIGKPVPDGVTPLERWTWLTQYNKGNFPPIKYTFEALEILKGGKHSKFEILGYSGLKGDESYESHTNDLFWKKMGGRTSNHFASCVTMPNFDIGYNYLVFVDKPYHRKSFELIVDEEDKWLQYVRDKVKERAAND